VELIRPGKVSSAKLYYIQDKDWQGGEDQGAAGQEGRPRPRRGKSA